MKMDPTAPLPKRTFNRVIKLAKSYMDSQEKWTTGEWARDKDGNPCHPRSEKACSFCIDGALMRAIFVVQGTMDGPTEFTEAKDDSGKIENGIKMEFEETVMYSRIRHTLVRQNKSVWPMVFNDTCNDYKEALGYFG